jgi:hypothetical protein
MLGCALSIENTVYVLITRNGNTIGNSETFVKEKGKK